MLREKILVGDPRRISLCVDGPRAALLIQFCCDQHDDNDTKLGTSSCICPYQRDRVISSLHDSSLGRLMEICAGSKKNRNRNTHPLHTFM